MKSPLHVLYEVSRDGKRMGSFTASELSSCLNDGTLRANDLYRAEGASEWRSLSSLVSSSACAKPSKKPLVVRHKGAVLACLFGSAVAWVGVLAIIRANRGTQTLEPTGSSASPLVVPKAHQTTNQIAKEHPPQTQASSDPRADIETRAIPGERQQQIERLFQRALKLSAENASDQDRAEGFQLLLEAAQQGHAGAQYKLGSLYYFGQSVSKDYVKALGWWVKAADQGDSDAQCSAAMLYANGEGGVPRDYAKAIHWYTKAAQQRNGGACQALGELYARGNGVPKNPAKALEWWTIAAEYDDQAQYNLGRRFEDGDGVRQDIARAWECFAAAAERGNKFAQQTLASEYSGVPIFRVYTNEDLSRDLVRAHFWWTLAGKFEFATELEKEMLPAQIDEAKRMARDFKPRKAVAANEHPSNEMIAESRPASEGTGFFVSTDGYLVTNAHVVEGSRIFRVRAGTLILSARLECKDVANDLAVLKVEGSFPCLPVISSKDAKLGGNVFTIGFPNIRLMGVTPKLAKGEIAGLSGAQDDPRYFQISVPTQPGNSGGALVDESGNVVGVVTAKLSPRTAVATSGALPENVNYALKSSLLLTLLEAIPDLGSRLTPSNQSPQRFEDLVRIVEKASVLVLTY